MKFEVTRKSPVKAACDVLVVGVFEGDKRPRAQDKAFGETLDPLFAQAKREGFEGKSSQIVEFTPGEAMAAHKVLLVGLGKRDEFNLDQLRGAISNTIKRCVALSAKRVAIASFGTDAIDAAAAAEGVVSVCILATYKYLAHKTADAKPCPIQTVTLLPCDSAEAKAASKGVERGRIIAEAICFARDLVNCPANVATPAYIADQACEMAQKYGLKSRVLKPAQMKKIGLNLILAVGQGSAQEPRFIIVEYKAPDAKKTVAIVGKGLTYDAGGLCLKPGKGMDTMKGDMAGAAAVLAAIRAAAELKAPVNILCVVPATENLPGGEAVKPGDIVTAFSGKTVEINDTDAEGRLILADAVAYAEKEKVDEIIDIATLTGACEVALGKKIAGLMATDQGMVERLKSAGAAGGEKLWQLPLEKEYEDTLKSDIADMKNCAREAGAITAAQFIGKHIDKTLWAHLDIAGTSWSEASPLMAAPGGTGFGVYALVNYVLGWEER